MSRTRNDDPGGYTGITAGLDPQRLSPRHTETTASSTPFSPAASANLELAVIPYRSEGLQLARTWQPRTSNLYHMLLAIDVGNTNTVLGLYRLATPQAPAALLADWRITTHRNPTIDELGILFRDLFALRSHGHRAGHRRRGLIRRPPLDSTLRKV